MAITYPSDRPPRRTVNDIRHDVISAARALRVHAVQEGRLRERQTQPSDLKAVADHVAECERLILKHFNNGVRKAAKEGEG